MKILIDTNIIISAVLYPNGIADKAYTKALEEPNVGLICDYCIDEAKKVFNRKFPSKIETLDAFIGKMLMVTTLLKTPSEKINSENLIRDENDRPILRAAIKAKADIILTGDKDFLESGITKPKMVSPADFINKKRIKTSNGVFSHSRR